MSNNLSLHELLQPLLPKLSPLLAQRAYEQGLAVTDAARGTTRPIPLVATPVIIDESEVVRRRRLTSLLASAGLKMARACWNGPQQPLLRDGLSPIERSASDAVMPSLAQLVTTRVDYFDHGQLQALELNATIPAMQAYSDIAAQVFIEGVGEALGLTPAARAGLIRANGSNAEALYLALLAGYGAAQQGRRPRHIALLARANDAQLTEQRSLAARFSALGTPADVVHPADLNFDGDRVTFRNAPLDLIYRHLFVRRLEELPTEVAGPLYSLLTSPHEWGVTVLNPPATPVEVKATFAKLSESQTNDELARSALLNDDERGAIQVLVPWTRVFRGEELLRAVAASPREYVLKRSWDYGGRAVFIGPSCDDPSFHERAEATYGRRMSWAELCEAAVNDTRGGGFVVQRAVHLPTQRHVICQPSGPVPVDLYVDFSMYASVGLGESPQWNGVCRGSAAQVVNIVGGGGVIPLLNSRVAHELVTAAVARRRD